MFKQLLVLNGERLIINLLALLTKLPDCEWKHSNLIKRTFFSSRTGKGGGKEGTCGKGDMQHGSRRRQSYLSATTAIIYLAKYFRQGANTPFTTGIFIVQPQWCNKAKNKVDYMCVRHYCTTTILLEMTFTPRSHVLYIARRFIIFPPVLFLRLEALASWRNDHMKYTTTTLGGEKFNVPAFTSGMFDSDDINNLSGGFN